MNIKTQNTLLQKLNYSRILQISFLIFIIEFVVILLLANRTEILKTFSIIFISIILEAMPFILLGTLLSGIIETFVSKDQMLRIFPKNSLITILIAAGFGLIFPVCECAIVPVVRRLLKKGISIGGAIAFLLGGPIVNSTVIFSTLFAYNFSWQIPLIRLLLGYSVASTIGILIHFIFKNKNILINKKQDHESDLDHGSHDNTHGDHDQDQIHNGKQKATFLQKMKQAVSHANNEFFDIVKFFIIGAFIASILQTVIPRVIIVSFARIPFLSILVMMLMAILLNLCSEADAFIAASFNNSGISIYAQMAFMVLGPMFDVKLLLMYFGVFKKRLIITLSISVIILVFISIIILRSIY